MSRDRAIAIPSRHLRLCHESIPHAVLLDTVPLLECTPQFLGTHTPVHHGTDVVSDAEQNLSVRGHLAYDPIVLRLHFGSSRIVWILCSWFGDRPSIIPH